MKTNINSVKNIIIDNCAYKNEVLGKNFVQWLSENLNDVIIVKNENELKN